MRSKKTSEELNILGATSGDTGSSAEYAMRGKKGVRVFMLSPHKRMSAFQTAQMFSLQDKNIFNIAMRGVFDDCQDIVKAVSNDAAFKAKQKIGTVNSINWARVCAQTVYYFKAYFAVTRSNDEKIDVAVPSGNFGNIYAGYLARRMGLPINHLILATNENNVLDEFFKTGVYRVRDVKPGRADIQSVNGYFQGLEFRTLHFRAGWSRCQHRKKIMAASRSRRIFRFAQYALF